MCVCVLWWWYSWFWYWRRPKSTFLTQNPIKFQTNIPKIKQNTRSHNWTTDINKCWKLFKDDNNNNKQQQQQHREMESERNLYISDLNRLFFCCCCGDNTLLFEQSIFSKLSPLVCIYVYLPCLQHSNREIIQCVCVCARARESFLCVSYFFYLNWYRHFAPWQA